MNGPSGIRATPAGKLMNVRTTGSSRPMNTVGLPHLHEEAVRRLDLVRPDEDVAPYRSRNGRPPQAPMA